MVNRIGGIPTSNLLILCLITLLCLSSCSDDATNPQRPQPANGWIVQESPVDNVILTAIWGIASDDVFAVGDDGTVVHYDGDSWELVPSGTTEDLNSVSGNSSDNVYAVGAGGTVIHFDGSEWRLLTGTRPVDFTGVSVTETGTVVACDVEGWLGSVSGPPGGCDGMLLGLWVNPIPLQYNAVAKEGFLCRVYSTPDRPLIVGSWDIGPEVLRGIWGFSEIVGDNLLADIIVVGDGGVIYRYDGTNWISETSTTSRGLRAVWGTSRNDLFVVGDAGTILRFDGMRWQAMPSGTDGDLYGVWSVSGDDIFAVGADGVILRYQR